MKQTRPAAPGPRPEPLLTVEQTAEVLNVSGKTVRRLIDAMVRDLIGEARRRLATLQPDSPAAVRAAREPAIAFSAGTAAGLAQLREFLRERDYRHYKVNRMSLKARRLVRELVDAFMAAPECLPTGWRERAGPRPSAGRVRRLAKRTRLRESACTSCMRSPGPSRGRGRSRPPYDIGRGADHRGGRLPAGPPSAAAGQVPVALHPDTGGVAAARRAGPHRG